MRPNTAGSADHAGAMASMSHAAGSDRVVAVLNERWRVVDDPLQWILQVRKGRPRAKASGYTSRRFCVSRTDLLGCIGELCGEVDPKALATIRALPERHPDWKRSRR